MRFNKAKAVRSAEKSLSQGKIQAAITEYRCIVEQDASDWTALNMLGDLYVRTGQPEDASKLFARVAEHYRSQGFALKAIAMYKKMLRMRPDDLAASGTLADLYASQGLVVEARAQLLSIADSYTQLNRTHEALDTLRRIADLDPLNPEVRLRVASAYAREHFADEAAAAYTEAGDRFLGRQSAEQALDAYSEALTLSPLHIGALAGTLTAHMQLGTPDEAAELFENVCAHEPRDAALLDMLLRAHLAAGNALSAEKTIERLLSVNPHDAASRMNLLEVARLYLKASDEDATVRVLTETLEAALTAGRDSELVEILEEVTTRDPEHLATLRQLVRIYTWQRDEAQLIQTLERIVETAQLSGSREEEVQALLRLYELVPDNAEYRERLSDVDALPANSDTPSAAPTSTGFDEVPTFESFMFTGDTSLADESLADGTSSSSAFNAGNDFNLIGDFDTSLEDVCAASASSTIDPSASFADLYDDSADEPGSANGVGATTPVEASDTAAAYQEIAWDTKSSAFSTDASSGTPASDDERITALLTNELESVDFYIAQGYADVASDTLDMLERQYGAHPAIEDRRSLLSQAATPDAGVSNQAGADAASEREFGDVGFGEVSLGGAPLGQDGIAGSTAMTEANFGEFSLDDFIETNPETSFDQLADFSITNSTASTPDDAPAAQLSTQRQAEAIAGEPAGMPAMEEFDAGLAAIFDEFRAAVEDETPVTVADYETHYNLGIAYQEMGLLDEAVEEFQKAASLASPGDGTPHYLQCCNFLGHCFMQKALPQLAVMWLRKGLDTPGHTEDEYQALRYELGNAYEAAGERSSAMATFMEVYGVDVSYRSVADKVRELRMQTKV
jgi:tetratricopeptide (TPR) repeat protein